ncbi:hypothetical protein Purlil1_12628 [Purpureocillium lilacinum]|uniref:Uncharacterized protein n=1 Tax=Purpureocillium lilacinum TaxID=33203 RepID=A0ABR0BGD5_PURLI|nr:hypothetical protein Purlil1_12628 [Purpureocillium lilacinum]
MASGHDATPKCAQSTMAAGDVPRPDTDVAGPGYPPDLLAGPATSSIHAVGSPSPSAMDAKHQWSDGNTAAPSNRPVHRIRPSAIPTRPTPLASVMGVILGHLLYRLCRQHEEAATRQTECAESGANRRVRVGNCTGRALHLHSPKYLDFSSSPAHGYGFPNRSPRAGCWFTDLNSSSLRLAFGRPNSHRTACTRRPMAEPHQMSQGKDTDAQLQKLFRVCIALEFSLLPLYPTPALRTAAPFRRHLAAGLTP